MKDQALFSSKYKSKKLRCRLLQFLFGALRVNIGMYYTNFTLSGIITINLQINVVNWYYFSIGKLKHDVSDLNYSADLWFNLK